MITHGIRFIADQGRTAASMLQMCNEIDRLRDGLPRLPVKVFVPPPSRIHERGKQKQPDQTWEAKYPCFNVDQGRESLTKAMRQRNNMRISEAEYERIERRIRTALREQFNVNDDAIVELCRLAVTMESG